MGQKPDAGAMAQRARAAAHGQSDDMCPLAKATGFKPGIERWKEGERAQLRAEVDAAYLRLYGIAEDDIEYILWKFQGVVNENEADHRANGGVGPTPKRIREALEWVKNNP